VPEFIALCATATKLRSKILAHAEVRIRLFIQFILWVICVTVTSQGLRQWRRKGQMGCDLRQ